ncbi:hypothetical protein COHA_007150 [Chlorella ohadii]|uniref:Amino acid transporter transmembrane domain-containing protein n=1 Tax=Chlorella ohadii TaxID=2649997 RepID=A0AAD5DJH4_9CHLO|nr:hypothetical protein COHA_007150 [Chlorella ohadii]
MLALPCAVSKTGIALGVLLFALVAALTFTSCSIIVRYAARWGVASYGDLVNTHFGKWGATVLQTAIAVHVSGVMIGYNVIIADVLVGSAPEYNGMLPSVLGRHDGPWWLTRAAVIAYLLVAVVVPTLVPRSLRVVAKFSSFSVCMLFLLASAISGLALVALAQGSIAQGVRWLPSYEAIGGSPLGALTSVLTVVSVSALAFTCQFNLLPIQKSLKDSSLGGMNRVLYVGLAFCAALYGTVAISGYALFGSHTEGDVLKNLTAGFVATMVPPAVASAIVYGVALSYTLCLLANFVLKVWAVREAVCELVFGHAAERLVAVPYYTVTYLLVAGAYLISVLVPSIYGLLALVGATATVVFSYFFPSLIVLKSGPTPWQRAGAYALLSIGALMSLTAIYDHLTGQSLE